MIAAHAIRLNDAIIFANDRPFVLIGGMNVIEDRDLLLDLMAFRYASIRRIKAEGRRSPHSFWVYVRKQGPNEMIVSFQGSPSSPLLHVVSIPPTPHAVIDSVVRFHRRFLSRLACPRPFRPPQSDRPPRHA